MSLHFRWPPEDYLLLHQGVTTGAGNVGGTTLIDTTLAGLPISAGLTIVAWLTDSTQIDTRSISAFDAVSQITVSRAFAAQVPAGTPYAILAIFSPADAITDADTAAINIFAGAVNIINLSPAALTHISGVLLSMNNCVAGATITVRVYRFVNGVERQIDEFTVVQGTDPDGILAVGPFIPVPAGANTFRVTMQSNNAGDVAVVVPYSYVLRSTP